MKLFATALLLWSSISSLAQDWHPLYDGRAPGNLTDTVHERRTGSAEDPELFSSVMTPMVEVFRPAKPNGTGLLIFPGGGYGVLVWKGEGTNIAKAFNEKGITCFIVKYRLPDHRYQAHAEDVPLTDAVAAMRWVKARTAEFQLDTSRIGCIGFSAGGHLAASFTNLAPADARSKFSILVYPVISMQPGLTHAGSRGQLLGPHPSAEAEVRYSQEWQVTMNTPPVYLTHTQDDRVVPVENSIRMYQALTAHHVNAEMHLPPKGDHGFLLKLAVPEWRDPMLKWLQSIGCYAPDIDGRGKTVILTFDDASQSHYSVIPALLKPYGFGATFYVCEFPPDFADSSKYMNWRQIQALSRMGYEIGNHGWHHASISGLSATQLEPEISYVEQKCREMGIAKPTSFCYPGYATDSAAIPILQQHGYLTARTGGDRPWEPGKDHPLYVPAYTINGNDPAYFYHALETATNSNAIVFCVHGVPDVAHSFVSTSPEIFRGYLQYLYDHHFRVVSMRDYTAGKSGRQRG